MPTVSRATHLESTLGRSLVEVVGQSKILMVGAGGIGCELLKNLVMSGFKNIEIIDLDTIDLSNLNRQFLFQKQHIKKSKAHIAKASALAFNPHVNIVSRHQNIKEEEFSVDWFKGFDLVMNALDNLDARRHVNKMCMAANVPLIESGTAGYLGQVTVIKKDVTECFDCQPKELPKTFPVCTIRSTPSTPIHCIVWAKSYLFPLLFGNSSEDDDDEQMSTNQQDANDEETSKELAVLKQESLALKGILESAGTDGFAARVFNKVFCADIHRLLTMTDMWKARKPPVPLVFEDIMAQEDAELEAPSTATTNATTTTTTPTTQESSTLKDQRLWGLKETLQVFSDSLDQLEVRLKEMRASDPEASIQFDKDDALTLDFVTATANLRARVYGIEEKSRFQVKAMAGNIIPAIATTNAIIAGMMVMLAFKILRNQLEECRTSYLVYGRQRAQLIVSEPLSAPNKKCYICPITYLTLEMDLEKRKVKDAVKILEGDAVGFEDVSLLESGRILYDYDLEDNLEKSLASMGLTDGKFLDVTDSEDRKAVVVLKHRTDLEEKGDGKEFYVLGGNVEEALKIPIKEEEKQEMEDGDEDDMIVSSTALPSDLTAATGSNKRKANSLNDNVTTTAEVLDLDSEPSQKKAAVGETVPPAAVPVGNSDSNTVVLDDGDDAMVVDGQTVEVVVLD